MSLTKVTDPYLLERLNEKDDSPSQNSGIFKSLMQAQGNYLKGAAKGSLQGLGDFGASAANAPISLAEKLLGQEMPHVPHPHLLEEQPGSLSELIGQKVGKNAAPLLIPGSAAFKAASLVPKAARNASLMAKIGSNVGKLSAAGAAGAATGYLGNEENRAQGALQGGIEGISGVGLGSSIKALSSLKSKNIAKDITKTMEDLKKSYIPKFEKPLEEGEKSGANNFLKSQSEPIKSMNKIGNQDYLHGVRKHNKNPSLTSAHEAQRDINYYISDLMTKKKSVLRDDAIKEAKLVKTNLLDSISDAFKKSGNDHLSNEYKQARIGYKEELGPYLNSKIIQQYQKGNIRKGKFADAILQDEKFLAKRGEHHPELRQREIISKILKNPITKHAAGYGLASLGLKSLANILK